MIDMKRITSLAAAAALAVMAFGPGAAQASPISILGNFSGAPPVLDYDSERAEVTCSQSCKAWYLTDASDASTGGWNDEFGTMLEWLGNSNESTEATFVNGILGTSFTSADANKIANSNDENPFSFTTLASYILMTVGRDPRLALIYNDSGVANTITWYGTGRGAGLSHATEFAPIPLPAAGFLLIGALGGLGLMARRKRKAA